MTDESMARPVSGEIMSDGAPRAARPSAEPGTVIDADYVSVVPPAPSRQRPPEPTQAAAQPGMDILKHAAPDGPRRGGPLFWLFGMVLVVGAFWVSGGHALVSRPAPAQPQTGAPAAAAGTALRIVEVTSRIEKSGTRSFLLVDGEVVNTGSRREDLPSLDIRVTDGAGRTTSYFLGTSDRRLAPDGRFAFSSRLEAPKDGVGTVTVDFRKDGQ